MANNSDYKNLFESRVRYLETENEQLLIQLHRAQDELEHSYSNSTSTELKRIPLPIARGGDGHGEDRGARELLQMLAENERLQALVSVQRDIHQLESKSALNVRLGNLLIEGADAPLTLLSTFGKLARIWRQSSRQAPPAALGGKDFGEVKHAYKEGGFALVEQLMANHSISPAMQANAYTALGRQLMDRDRASAAEAARRAHSLDPKPYRLKWLAFRLHEAGSVIEAEAMLDLLPVDTPFSESEARQARQARHEAKGARERAAKQASAFVESRAAVESQLSLLKRQGDEQTKLAAEHAREVEALKKANAKFVQEELALVERNEKQARLVAERDREIALLKQTSAAREAEARALASVREQFELQLGENRSLLDNLYQVQEELEHLHDELNQLEQEKQALTLEHNSAQSKLAEAHKREVEALAQAKEKLQQENHRLMLEHNGAQSKLAEAHKREVEALVQAKEKLQQENNKLTVERDVQLGLVKAREREFEALNLAKAALDQEKQALAATHEAQTQVAQARDRDFEVMRQAKARLEKEKLDLAAKHEAQSKATEARDREIDTLKKAKVQLEQEKTALKTRNQISARKNSKGDADIDDLIVDLDLFFSGKAIIYADVGSYVGDVFLKIKRGAKKFRIHEAHLFEPNPVSYELLTNKVGAEEGTIVHTYNLAVGSSSGTEQFIKAKSMTKALSGEAEVGGAPADVFTARRVGLDSQRSIFTDGKINLLKIDVEGKELDVLASAQELLASQSVDILYIEVGFNRLGTQQTYFAEVDRLLQPLGYRVLRIYEQKEEWMSDSPVLRRANIAYMSEKFANAHPLKLMLEIQELKDKLNEINKAKAGGEAT